MPILVETDSVIIKRETLDEVIVNLTNIWTSFLFGNDDILLFREVILRGESNDLFKIRFQDNLVYLESATWALYMTTEIFEELKLAMEIAPVSDLIPSDFKTIRLVKEEKNSKSKDNLIYFQLESMRRKNQ